MLSYYLKLSWLSMRRTPVLTALMIVAIGLGVGACMTMVTINYVLSADPIPQKSDRLFHVQLDTWSPDEAYGNHDQMPRQLPFRDTEFLSGANLALREAGMFPSSGAIQPVGQVDQPFLSIGRVTDGDFFAMFDVPFRYGAAWDAATEKNQERVIVLSRSMNERLFGDVDSTGNVINLWGEDFKVVGVIDTWQPLPLFYDVVNKGAGYDAEDEFFVPLSLTRPLEIGIAGNTSCWRSPEGDGFESFADSECIWSTTWVELESAADEAEYEQALLAYIAQQKELGRFPRPARADIKNVMDWMDSEDVVGDDAPMLMAIAFLFLLVCLLNTVGLLLAKFLAKSGEIGLRRAVGASRRDLFTQHLIEAGAIGVAGGAAGLLLAWLGLISIRTLLAEFDRVASMDPILVGVAVALAVISAVAAGLYPTWRACRISPAIQLKTQ